MTVRVEVKAELLVWARHRSGIHVDDISRRFPKLPEWESGEISPTLRQLEDFARVTHTAVGFLFLSEPPIDRLPVPDFRTMKNAKVGPLSPDLLDTVYICQQRQAWYRHFVESNLGAALPFVGSLKVESDILEAGSTISEELDFGVGQRGSSWGAALRKLADGSEALGVLVMASGIVGSNTHRKLDPDEFRGFALVDDLAPLVFVNSADTKSAQIFTLAHELAHIWLGQSAVSNPEISSAPNNVAERWCNEVAAELLVPLHLLRRAFRIDPELTRELERLAQLFRVSTLVVLRRIHDAGFLTMSVFQTEYLRELDRVLTLLGDRPPSIGGNFYNTQPIRASKRFTRALIGSTLEGQTLYRDAFQMLGLKKHETFEELARHLGMK